MNQPVNPVGPNDGDRDQGRRFLEDPLTRFDARVLDPSTAVRLTGGEAPSATVYVGDTLLVTASDRGDAEELLELLRKALELSRLPLRWVERNPFRPSDDPDHDRRARLLTLAAEFKLPLVFPVRFEAASDGPAPAVDVWPLLQAIRQAAFDDEDMRRLSRAVGLNHLMAAAADISGNPYTKGMATIFGNPYTQGNGQRFRQSLHQRDGRRGSRAMRRPVPVAGDRSRWCCRHRRCAPRTRSIRGSWCWTPASVRTRGWMPHR